MRFLRPEGLAPERFAPARSAAAYFPPARAVRISQIVVLALLTLAAAGVSFAPALAHHGWSWAEEAQSMLTGTIEAISMDPPHPSLKVKAEDGTVWQIDLANPAATERAGWRGDSAKPGEAITILGNRSLDADEKRMKAVRITVGGKNYDMYPDRIEAD